MFPEWIAPTTMLVAFVVLLVAAAICGGAAYAELHHYHSTRDAVLITGMGSGFLTLALVVMEVATSAA
ncbi:hypothetical protein E1265_21305 [Streptomyces sp. 8K308]|uniref:hypothetical protein n=1 Tax=Streptomyces sp. 8K308 TaxID=2530388 RepID=UPI0010464C99|nr:hypothetical protein [Streptomyces sp. 8K308]TDC20610.1 hypothetical protein E1265_21305 [Streptomyces sp. 8K308]